MRKQRITIEEYEQFKSIRNATPEDHVNFMARLFPGVWDYVEDVIKDHAHRWPKWCFMPLYFWSEIVNHISEMVNLPQTPKSHADITTQLAAAGTWRYCKGIYKFDDTLFDELTSQEFDGKIPMHALYNLPEWCIYIETDYKISWGEYKIKGFFMNLSVARFKDDGQEHKERHDIGFVLNDGTVAPVLTALAITDLTVDQTMDQMVEDRKRRSETSGEYIGCNPESLANDKVFFKKVLPLILYLCSDEPDVDDLKEPGVAPYRATPKKTKKGFKLFAPHKLRTWTVGRKLGEQLREAASHAKSTGKSPHLRRAHWHGYWLGPRDGERQFKYKWLPPIFVSPDEKKEIKEYVET